jgi:hypothetical protein
VSWQYLAEHRVHGEPIVTFKILERHPTMSLIAARKDARKHFAKWAKWSLAEMSVSPAAVRDWHIAVTKKSGPAAANHAARVLRAAYRYAN